MHAQAILREHPKGLKPSGKGSASRQKHAQATLAAIVMEKLKVRTRLLSLCALVSSGTRHACMC